VPGSILIARVLGIDIRIHLSWFLIFALILLSLADRVLPELRPHWSDQKTIIVAAITDAVRRVRSRTDRSRRVMVIKAEGVKRKLVGIEIDGDRIGFNTTKWPVTVQGEPVGRVTSAIWSPRLRKNIGYAMVPMAHASLGTALSVEIPAVGERRATVVPKPFVDPKKEIPKS
jgi:hypothetical protein